MVFRPDRRRRSDRFLEWKVRIFSVAAALVLVGMYMDARWMTGLALAMLCGGMLLRFLPGGGVAERGEDDEQDDDDGGMDGFVESSDGEDEADGREGVERG